MSRIAVTGNPLGTGTFTIASPNSNSDRTLTLPDASGTLNTSGAPNVVPAGTVSAPSITTDGDTNTGIFFPAADTIAFTEGGVEAMRITSAGNVGIGTGSPGSKLTVDGTVRSTTLSVANSVSSVNQFANFTVDSVGLNIVSSYASSGSANILFSPLGTERARIDSSGQFLNNCTGLTGDAPNAAGGRLLQTNGNEKIRVNVDAQPAFQFYSPGGGTGSPVGTVTANASSTSYNTSSDYRLKESIAPMTGALARVAALKPCTYTWKSTGEQSQGFIAHELQEVVPECVTGEKDGVETYTDEDGVEQTRPRYQGIDTSFLVATLTAAIQELNAKVDAQAAEIAALKGQA